MKKINHIQSKYITLDIADIDTDMIFPAQYLTTLSHEGHGKNLFFGLRNDPDFPMNHKKNRDRKVLVTRRGFGCGSSREHAVWALLDWGISAIISPSFGDIFASNAAKNGLLLIQIDEQGEKTLFEPDNTDMILDISLENETVQGENIYFSFHYDLFRKHCLLHGLSDIDYLLEHTKNIDDWKTDQPWITESLYLPR